MRALSELWGMDEQTLDTFIRSRNHRIGPAERNGTNSDAVMLGDRMLAGVCRSITRTVEINAPVDRAWPWLAQMMRGGGIYGWETLETPACRSARHLVGNLPEPRLGDQVNGNLILASVDPGREMVWAATEPFRLFGHDISGLTLNYMLEPAGDGCCKLSARLRFASRGMTEQVTTLLCNILDGLLIGSQVKRLRDCIETYTPERFEQAPQATHQMAPFRPALQAWVPPRERKLCK